MSNLENKRIGFFKYHACGNDYVYIDCFDKIVDNPENLAIKVSKQHFGVGSDGLILIESSKVADAKMRIFNSDGSEAKMCGNGIRCVGKYLFDEKKFSKRISIETLSGIKYIEILNSQRQVSMVKVNMGTPEVLNQFKKSEFANISDAFYVSIGNPHCVMFFDNIESIGVCKIGEKIQNLDYFNSGVNVEFVKVNSRKDIDMRVFERGSGETLACGTGACASVVVANFIGLCDKKVTVHLRGGDILVECIDDLVYMTGEAVKVFEGNFFI